MDKAPAELIHALGTLFGESQQIDRNIVNHSTNLHGTSNGVQQSLQQTIQALRNAPPEPVNTPQVYAPPIRDEHQTPEVGDFPFAPVSPFTPGIVVQPTNTPNLVFTPKHDVINSQELEVLKSIDVKLSVLIDLLTKKKNATKPRKRKPRKVPTES